MTSPDALLAAASAFLDLAAREPDPYRQTYLGVASDSLRLAGARGADVARRVDLERQLAALSPVVEA
jgi:hypothetical protein